MYCLGNAESEALAIFLVYLQLLPLPLETEKSSKFNQKETRKRLKTDVDCWSENFRNRQVKIINHLCSVITSGIPMKR